MKRLLLILFLLLLMTGCASANQKKTVNVTGLELSENEIYLRSDKADAAHLEVFVYPENAEIVWSSENESIVHVDSGGNIYPCGVGTAEITASAGGHEAKCTVNVEADAMNEIPEKYTGYPVTLYDMVMIQMKASPVSYDTLNNEKGKKKELAAPDEEVEGFANPQNFMTGHSKYQFLVLNEENGIEARVLNEYLTGKGALDGMGEVFKKAAQDNGVSEVFLTLYACYETENGTSEPANGIEVNNKTVYNVFGVDDPDAISDERFAYEMGWTSLEAAIEGGARRLSERYLNNSRYDQNTLYKMRWDPESPGTNQYTSEVEWADNTARSMGPMIEAFPTAVWSFEIPVYEKGRAVAG